MSGYVEQGRVCFNEPLGADVWRMRVEAPLQAAAAAVGTFANLRITGGVAPLLRRPISYADFDAQQGTVDFIYRVVGVGTEGLTRCRIGDTVDTLGPLGTPFHPTENMLLVGGGVGIAPLLAMVAHRPAGSRVTVVLGTRGIREKFWVDLCTPYDVEVHCTSDDGTMGIAGFPTVVVEQLLASNRRFTSIHTCGPTPMMRAVAALAQRHRIPVEVSLEEHMGCGTGGCLGCACAGASGRRYKVCTDGPVFPGEEVFPYDR